MQEVGEIIFHDYQINFLIDCIRDKRIVGVFARQTGKTTCMGLYALWYAFHHPKENILIIAPTDRQASELFGRMKLCAENKLQTKIGTLREIRLDNGSLIRALPTGDFGNTIRGQTAHVLILEESGNIKDSIINAVIMPMIAATDGQVIQIGTPQGRNHFYNATQDKNYKFHHYAWDVCPHYKEHFVEEQKNELTEGQFAAEYLAEFRADSNCFFPDALINNIVSDEIPIREFSSPEHTYYMGVDLAKLGQDSCVIMIVECINPTQLQLIKLMELKQRELREAEVAIKYLDAQFKCVKICVDKTGMGEKMVEDLRASLGSKLIGIPFTLQSKMDMYNNLKLKMEKGHIRIPKHQKLIWQLKEIRWEKSEFEDKFKIHHPERGFDDFPDPLALAVYPFSASQRNIVWGVH